MSKISAIRRSNLIRLRHSIEEDYNNIEKSNIRFTDKVFCQIVGLRTTTYSQLKSPKHKPHFNEIYARRIEDNLGLESGWFDENRDESDFMLLKINFKKFQVALKAYSNFIVNGNIKIEDDAVFERVEKKLFLTVFRNNVDGGFRISENDFYDFLKNKDLFDS